ncbi:MAG: hypothetical protein ACRC2H_04435, partial [Silanimonas sp.]
MSLAPFPAPTHALPVARLDLVLIGARGQVGTAFRHRLAEQQAAIARRSGLDLRLLSAFDRRGFAYDLEGLAPAGLEAALRPRREDEIDALFTHLQSPRQAPA